MAALAQSPRDLFQSQECANDCFIYPVTRGESSFPKASITARCYLLEHHIAHAYNVPQHQVLVKPTNTFRQHRPASHCAGPRLTPLMMHYNCCFQKTKRKKVHKPSKFAPTRATATRPR